MDDIKQEIRIATNEFLRLGRELEKATAEQRDKLEQQRSQLHNKLSILYRQEYERRDIVSFDDDR
jgi:hypothetical protein